jgi:hypothetical protein
MPWPQSGRIQDDRVIICHYENQLAQWVTVMITIIRLQSSIGFSPSLHAAQQIENRDQEVFEQSTVKDLSKSQLWVFECLVDWDVFIYKGLPAIAICWTLRLLTRWSEEPSASKAERINERDARMDEAQVN